MVYSLALFGGPSVGGLGCIIGSLTVIKCCLSVLCYPLKQDNKKLEDDSVNKRRRKGNHYLSEVC